MEKKPKSPIRFKKIAIDPRARPKEAGCDDPNPPSVRRAIPGLDATIASGSPTSGESPNSGVVWGGIPYFPGPYVKGGRPTLPLIIALSGNHFGNASAMYRESRTGPAKGGAVQVSD